MTRSSNRQATRRWDWFARTACIAAQANGAPGGIRTPDPRLRRPMLYPTELQARRAVTIHQECRVPTPCRRWVPTRCSGRARSRSTWGTACTCRERTHARCARSHFGTTSQGPAQSVKRLVTAKSRQPISTTSKGGCRDRRPRTLATYSSLLRRRLAPRRYTDRSGVVVLGARYPFTRRPLNRPDPPLEWRRRAPGEGSDKPFSVSTRCGLTATDPHDRLRSSFTPARHQRPSAAGSTTIVLCLRSTE